LVKNVSESCHPDLPARQTGPEPVHCHPEPACGRQALRLVSFCAETSWTFGPPPYMKKPGFRFSAAHGPTALTPRLSLGAVSEVEWAVPEQGRREGEGACASGSAGGSTERPRMFGLEEPAAAKADRGEEFWHTPAARLKPCPFADGGIGRQDWGMQVARLLDFLPQQF